MTILPFISAGCVMFFVTALFIFLNEVRFKS